MGIFIMENFYDIVGFKGHQITKSGIVKRLAFKGPGTFTTKDYVLKPHKNKYGYLTFTMRSDCGIKKYLSQHRLLALNFIDNPNNYKCVNHINGIRNDNRLENLEWCSYSQNSKHGYDSNGRKNAMRKLTELQVIEIKEKLKNFKIGMGVELAKEYNVSVWIISLIKNNKTYVNV
jgi:hypothetical protein